MPAVGLHHIENSRRKWMEKITETAGDKQIKIIALDLDGTTLCEGSRLSEGNKKAIEDAIAMGVNVCISTGRSFTAVPDVLLNVKGLRYVISSNGAHVTDLSTGEQIYSSYIDPEAVDESVRIARENRLTLEAFYGDRAYIDRELYDEIRDFGCSFRPRDYVLKTRTPLDDIFSFITSHKEHIENINFFFPTVDDRKKWQPLLESIPDATVLSSVPNNIEIGGNNTNKSIALKFIMDRLGLSYSQLMCMGDAPNDIPMIRDAGIGVAMGNAWDQVKEAADYVTDTNDRDGVAKAIEKFVLKR